MSQGRKSAVALGADAAPADITTTTLIDTRKFNLIPSSRRFLFRAKQASCALVYIATIHRLQIQQKLLRQTELKPPHPRTSTAGSSSNMFRPTTVDQNQLVRHFLKSHPEISEALIKEFLIEHPTSASKLLRLFRGTNKRRSKPQRRQSAVTVSPVLLPVPGNSGNSTSGGINENTISNSASLPELQFTNSADVLQSDDEETEEDEEDTLENIRTVAQEIVRKKTNNNFNDLALATQWQTNIATTKNLDAALNQHRTYLQEVAALDENELFMELIRDVGKKQFYFTVFYFISFLYGLKYPISWNYKFYRRWLSRREAVIKF